jgi:hypothetical protein
VKLHRHTRNKSRISSLSSSLMKPVTYIKRKIKKSVGLSSFPSVARRCIVTRNAGSRIPHLFQHVLKQSHERGLQRIRPLPLPVG